jgi:hypothetical protein
MKRQRPWSGYLSASAELGAGFQHGRQIIRASSSGLGLRAMHETKVVSVANKVGKHLGLELGPLMACKSLLMTVLLLAFAEPALANWWIVRSSDEKCLVVDIEPSGNDKTVTKVGKDVYQTREQAEADAKRLCKESKVEDQPPE